jgi:hypothetical protein
MIQRLVDESAGDLARSMATEGHEVTAARAIGMALAYLQNGAHGAAQAILERFVELLDEASEAGDGDPAGPDQ